MTLDSAGARNARLPPRGDNVRDWTLKTPGVVDVSTRTYWLDLFSPTTWQEFLEAGGTVSGFRESRWNTVQQIKPGDYLLCYLTQVSRFVGLLEVTSEPYLDKTPSIWKDEHFPCRVDVEVVAALPVDAAVPIMELSDQLSFFQNMTGPHAWTGRVRGSPTRWSESDGETVTLAVLEAQAHPVIRPVDPRKLAKKPPVVDTKIGPVTVPVDDEPTEAPVAIPEIVTEVVQEATAHTEIQWRLLKLGSDMSLDVWVARNDRNRAYDGQPFSAMPRLRHTLPNQFDEATNRTVELIDVLWLKGNAFVAAFEIESTTSIYSGLLRMADLLAMQPNLNIPLYLVAPDDRRTKVLSEVNRPTFSRLSPPLKQVCRYLAFSALRDQLPEDPRVVRHLTPAFLGDFSESCEIETL
jgi:predicted RNA-binding protein